MPPSCVYGCPLSPTHSPPGDTPPLPLPIAQASKPTPGHVRLVSLLGGTKWTPLGVPPALWPVAALAQAQHKGVMVGVVLRWPGWVGVAPSGGFVNQPQGAGVREVP